MNKFVIAITVRNANLRAGTVQIGHLDPANDLPASYIERCLLSARQDYQDYRIVIRDDASTDGTWERIQEIIATMPIPVDAQQNRQRIWQAGNFFRLAQAVEDDEIVVVLDGDDHLAHGQVLRKLDEVYRDPEVWLTYGSFAYDEASRDPRPEIDPRGMAAPLTEHSRRGPFSCSHLKTYRRWLFDRIRPEDLQRDGHYYPIIGDLVTMFPLVEMAGPEHARYIHDILYLYNIVNPYNELKGPGAWPTDTLDQREEKESGRRLFGHEHILIRDEIAEAMTFFSRQRMYPRLAKAKDYPIW